MKGCQSKTVDISICCITYNHADYIENCLNGFLSQKFNGTIEIIIHDDASTDGTIDILKKYQERFPDKIILQIEQENKYSRGEKMYIKPISIASGKYIAICEGDDYWVSSSKLQKQYDYMEAHEDCTYCVHAAHIEVYDRAKKKMYRTFKGSRKFNLSDVLTKGLQFPTASVFARKNCLDEIPDFYLNAPVEDEPFKFLCLSKGKGYYFDEPLCVYRKNRPGSWNILVKSNKEKKIRHYERKIEMFNELNAYLNDRYKKEIVEAINIEEFNVIMAKRDYKQLKNRKFVPFVRSFPFLTRMRIKFAMYFPATYAALIRIIKGK